MRSSVAALALDGRDCGARAGGVLLLGEAERALGPAHVQHRHDEHHGREERGGGERVLVGEPPRAHPALEREGDQTRREGRRQPARLRGRCDEHHDDRGHERNGADVPVDRHDRDLLDVEEGRAQQDASRGAVRTDQRVGDPQPHRGRRQQHGHRRLGMRGDGDAHGECGQNSDRPEQP
jgi:hypothetical protein